MNWYRSEYFFVVVRVLILKWNDGTTICEIDCSKRARIGVMQIDGTRIVVYERFQRNQIDLPRNRYWICLFRKFCFLFSCTCVFGTYFISGLFFYASTVGNSFLYRLNRSELEWNDVLRITRFELNVRRDFLIRPYVWASGIVKKKYHRRNLIG